MPFGLKIGWALTLRWRPLRPLRTTAKSPTANREVLATCRLSGLKAGTSITEAFHAPGRRRKGAAPPSIATYAHVSLSGLKIGVPARMSE